jgi:hypothetical protein
LFVEIGKLMLKTKLRTYTRVLSLLMMVSLLAACQAPGETFDDDNPNTKTSVSASKKKTPASPSNPAPSGSKPSSSSDSPTQPPIVATGFYLAQMEADSNLMAVRLDDAQIYVHRQPVLTQADLSEAAALVDKNGKNFVGLRFTSAGARKLQQLSSQNIGKLLALVVDGQVLAAPRMSEPLSRGVLAFGVDTVELANDIAAQVRGDTQATPGQPAPLSPSSNSGSSSKR